MRKKVDKEIDKQEEKKEAKKKENRRKSKLITEEEDKNSRHKSVLVPTEQPLLEGAEKKAENKNFRKSRTGANEEDTGLLTTINDAVKEEDKSSSGDDSVTESISSESESS